jgi:NADPH:quinone reductase-like Zn-dependent oxidoreductase
VFGIGKGSFAEFAAAPERKVARKPRNLSFEQAAAVPVSGMTPLRGLCDVGHLQAGQRVWIVGASGGVGSYAVQIAKAVGAEVTGVCSTSKLDLVRSIGADHVIDDSRDDFADGEKRYDLILDIGGNSPLSRLRRALTPRGTLVIAGGEDEAAGSAWIASCERSPSRRSSASG